MQRKVTKGKFIVITCIIMVLAIISVFALNYILLQSNINYVITSDKRNNGIGISVHYRNYINPSILIYDLISVSSENSMADVFRVFLQFADKMQAKQFDVIELCFKGNTKFKISGIYFQTLGNEYSFQNPVYTVRTFPEHLSNPDGSKAYPEWTGGWLGVAMKQIQDFNDFHKKWWLEDMTN